MWLFKKKRGSNIGPQPGYETPEWGFGTHKFIPSLSRWLDDSNCGGGHPATRDWVLRLIDRYLCAFHHRRDWENWWEAVSILGQLYFLTDHWLRESPAPHSKINQKREPWVRELFEAVVDNLCFLLDCKVNYLPEMIELYWGRILTDGGYYTDNQNPSGRGILPRHIPRSMLPTVADYLTAAEREKYRLIFCDGLAYQTTWWKEKPFRRIPAESKVVGWTDAEGPHAWQTMEEREKMKKGRMMEDGFAGFALSMGRDFYIATHHRNYARHNFYHSSYLAGGTVLCTGSMKIVHGHVLAIKNDSGHYRPTLEHLVSVLQALEMYRVPPRQVRVIVTANSWKLPNGRSGPRTEMWGDELLHRRAIEGKDARIRKIANRDNIDERRKPHP
jgi:hypothetical protein